MVPSSVELKATAADCAGRDESNEEREETTGEDEEAKGVVRGESGDKVGDKAKEGFDQLGTPIKGWVRTSTRVSRQVNRLPSPSNSSTRASTPKPGVRPGTWAWMTEVVE